MATAAANRGKVAENKVREILNKFNDNVAGFTFNRNLDAHAAGGRFPAQAGDFQAFKCGRFKANAEEAKITYPKNGEEWAIVLAAMVATASRNFIIEVKETKEKERLPHGNYSSDKVSRVKIRTWAGTEAVVAILHTTTGVWRLVPFEVFTTRIGGSWKLSAYPAVDIETALAEFMGVN